MPKIKRELLLNQLESIKAGLSVREIIEQSSCFVFKDGKVMTYNDEISCSQESELDIEGAVQATAFMEVLNRMPTEYVDISVTDKELVLKSGKSRTSGIHMEMDILLPIDTVEKPKKWKKLDVDFIDAIYIVSQCVGKDETQFVLTCINITPDHVEACDNFQASQYSLSTGIKSQCLVRADSIKHIIDLDMVDFSETKSWLHFRNPTGLILSCRKTNEEYPELGQLLDASGAPTTLPKGLAEAADTANIFSRENVDNDSVMINITPKNGGMLRVQGEGSSGWYKEVKKLKYNGNAIKFRIAPKLLIELTKRHNECELSSDRLIVRGNKFIYISCLGVVND